MRHKSSSFLASNVSNRRQKATAYAVALWLGFPEIMVKHLCGLIYVSIACVTKQIKSEQLAFIIFVFTNDVSFGNFAALN